MSKVFTKLCINILFLYISTLLFPSIFYNSGFDLIIAGSVLWIINLCVRPIILLISLPVNLLTFGLFSFIINTWMLLMTDTLLLGIKIPNFTTALFASIIISLGNVWYKKISDK